LCLDYSDSTITNTAVIKYPDQPIELLSDFFGGSNPYQAFLVRVHTLDADDSNMAQDSREFNVYKGQADKFPDTESWQLLNPEPVDNLWFVDDTWTDDDETGQYRYAVETIYTAGNSEETFSNIIDWEMITATLDPDEFEGRFELYPVPASEYITVDIELETEADMELVIYSASGQLIDRRDLGLNRSFTMSRMVDDLAAGSYFLGLYVDGRVLTKTFVVVRD
jgi:type IX secretion system substrate protein